MRLTGKVILILVISVTSIISVIFYVLASRFDRYLEYSLLSTARSLYKNVIIVRKWVSDYEGVYVKKRSDAKSNPYLPHPELMTSQGDTLTLKNPALVTRELSELSQFMGGNFSFHMASRDYINPTNQPDSFETKALMYFEDSLRTEQLQSQWSDGQEFYQHEEIDGTTYFRYFAPIYVQESCLTCHGSQGYQKGDLRGGISILLSTGPYRKVKQENWTFFVISAVLTIIFLSILIFVAIRRSVIRPLRKIEDSAQHIKEGNYDFQLSHSKNDEIGSLANVFEEMRQKIKTSTQKLKMSEEKYRNLIEHSLEAVAIINSNGQIIENNDNFTRLTGYKPEILDELNFFDLIDSENRQLIKSTNHREVQAEHYETVLFSRDKLEIPVEIYMIKGFSVGTESDLSFVYVRDLSERKKIEQYSIQAEKMFALGQMSSGIAHEIRNPLFALHNNLDYLQERIPDDLKDVFPEMNDGVNRIQKIVSEILNFARPHTPEFKPIKISEIVQNSLVLMQQQLEKSAIKIETDFEEDFTEVEADAHQLEQVFINLFLNAFQAMDGAGILTVHVQSLADKCEVIIEDTGRGIPREEIDRIFDPFYTKSPNGTGLGLAIVQRILDQHSASYRVVSEPNFGTTFYIYLSYKQE